KRVDFSQGFDTIFDLSFITLTPGSSGADGVGFTIQNQGNSSMPPSEKGFTAKSFTVNFDSYINDDTEKSAATIQIVTNGNIEKIINLPTEFPTALGAGVTDFTQSTGGAAPYPVRVTYGSGLLNIYVNSVQVLTNYPINLSTLGAVDASGKGYVGFSARTGGIFEAHDVTAWSLTPGAPVSTGNPLAITASSINAATGALSLTWTSNAAKTYRITASTDLTTWTTVLKSGIASGGSTTTSATTFTPGAKGFFRVEEE
ncbi:MAG: gdhB 2, partial [Akkermansiaceae bacterium]|nr:gdhB 2 [Akkermansiaceae bacterium]